MKKFFLKNIFAVVLFTFLLMPILKAEEDVSISTNSADFISTTNILDVWPLSKEESSVGYKGSGSYKYIIFNASSTYGGESVAKSTCDKYCNGCQKYSSYTNSGSVFYSCKIYNLKSSYFAVHNKAVPSVIKEVDSITFPKVTSTYKCQYVKMTDEKQVLNNNGVTYAAVYFWTCESKLDCDKTCSGACSTFGLTMYLDKRKELSYCAGRKLPNVFVTVDGKEVNADTLSAISDTDLKDWVAKTGDGIKAGFKGILIVIGSQSKITCSGALGDAIDIVKYVFNFIKIGSVIMLILFSTLDFMKAATGESKDMKKATENFIKRAIVVVVLFMLPSLINLILSIIGYSQGVCGL